MEIFGAPVPRPLVSEILDVPLLVVHRALHCFFPQCAEKSSYATVVGVVD